MTLVETKYGKLLSDHVGRTGGLSDSPTAGTRLIELELPQSKSPSGTAGRLPSFYRFFFPKRPVLSLSH
jgi:hypothetical protein